MLRPTAMPLSRNSFCNSLARFRIAVHDHRHRAFGGAGPHDGCADSLGPAGHDDDFILQLNKDPSVRRRSISWLAVQIEKAAIKRIIHPGNKGSLIRTQEKRKRGNFAGFRHSSDRLRL